MTVVEHNSTNCSSHLFESKKMTNDKISGNKTSLTLYLGLFTNFFIAAGHNVRQGLFPQCPIFSWDMIFHNPKENVCSQSRCSKLYLECCGNPREALERSHTQPQKAHSWSRKQFESGASRRCACHC